MKSLSILEESPCPAISNLWEDLPFDYAQNIDIQPLLVVIAIIGWTLSDELTANKTSA